MMCPLDDGEIGQVYYRKPADIEKELAVRACDRIPSSRPRSSPKRKVTFGYILSDFCRLHRLQRSLNVYI